MEKEAILVSACLLGVPCRYDGASKPCSAVESLRTHYRLIPICPEQSGGLPTPRPASEIGTDGRVRNRPGADVTAEYLAGAEAALRVAQENGCRLAVLKEKVLPVVLGKSTTAVSAENWSRETELRFGCYRNTASGSSERAKFPG